MPLVYEFGNFRLDPASRSLQRADGATVAIGAKAFDVLIRLVEARGRVMESAELMRLLWPRREVEENNLRKQISAVRRALGDFGNEPSRFIVTLPRRGYQFVAQVRMIGGNERAVAHVTAGGVRGTGAVDREAYELYLQARAIQYRTDPVSVSQGRVLLSAAIERDPGFARARGELAINRWAELSWAQPVRLPEVESEARAALALDPELAEAHFVLGNIWASQGRFVEAERSYRRAQADHAVDGIAYADHATFLLTPVGHLTRALDQAMRGYRTSPTNSAVVGLLALLYCFRGDDAEAARYMDRAMALGFDIPAMPQTLRAFASLRAGRWQEAAEAAAGSLPPPLRAGPCAEAIRSAYIALSREGLRDAALKSLRRLPETIVEGPAVVVELVSHAMLASTLLGDSGWAHHLASLALDRAREEGCVGRFWGIAWLPEMRRFRQHAAFGPLMTRAGFRDYWDEYGPPD